MARDAAAWAARRKKLEQDISATHPKNRRRATATQDAMSAMKSRWAEFSNVVFNGESAKDTICKAGVTDFKLFLEWHLENSKVGALSTLETRWKYLRLYYTCEVGHAMDKYMSTEITAFLSQLAFKADLQQDKKPKGVITHHDVGHLLRSHWEYEWRLKDGRRRVELALIVLLLSYTAGRPGAVLDKTSRSSLLQRSRSSLVQREIGKKDVMKAPLIKATEVKY
ncbi:hypothetical protein EV426DRAFT_611000 [Tirmania nivea]|nr:hypothetical protein EV426DRAFT_611000 [Tirmania nivea]